AEALCIYLHAEALSMDLVVVSCAIPPLCPVRNHTSGRESIGDDECEHSLRRRCDHANEAGALQNSRCGPSVLACSSGSVCHGGGRQSPPFSAGRPYTSAQPQPPSFAPTPAPPPRPAKRLPSTAARPPRAGR